MNIEIRQAKEKDYNRIVEMSKDQGDKLIPSWEEVREINLVALVFDKVVGYIHANKGNCASAHIDRLIVDKDYRWKAKGTDRTEVGIRLAIAMFDELINRGSTLICAELLDNKIGRILAGFYQEIGFDIIPCYGILRGSASVLKKRLENKIGVKND